MTHRRGGLWFVLMAALLAVWPAARATAGEGAAVSEGKEFQTLAEGQMRAGGSWKVVAQAFEYEQTVCWGLRTERTAPKYPPLPTPQVTTGLGGTACDTRPRPGQLGQHLAYVRCDAATALVTGGLGRRLRRPRAVFADGRTAAMTRVVLRPKDGLPAAPGYYGIFALDERPVSVAARDKKTDKTKTAAITWRNCDGEQSES